MKTAIIDYGMSNLGSIRQAVEECGGNPIVVTDPIDLGVATHIILPGVGSFADGMKNLNSMGWTPAIRKAALEDKIPFLGICLGMQLLADKGFENGKNNGLGLIHGVVEKLVPKEPTERIPHVGWNEIHEKNPSVLTEGIPDGTDFYFVHSYFFKTKNDISIVNITPYCGGFASIINDANVFGTQFHPEKSQRPGFKILKNFLNI